MYFSADAGDGFHIWRQRFPDGTPEQVTSGPTEEEGLAFAADGKSLITSVSLTMRSVWYHDTSGERQISLEGYAYYPLLSADGQKICFRVTRGVGTGQSPSELWMVELGSGRKHRLFPGQLVTGYDVSHDDRVVAAVWSGMDRRQCGWHGSTAANRHGEFRRQTAIILDLVLMEKSCFGYPNAIPECCTDPGEWRTSREDCPSQRRGVWLRSHRTASG